MNEFIPDDTEAQADWLKRFEAAERDTNELVDAAKERRRWYRWIVAGFAVVAVALQLTSPTGLPPLLFGALLAFVCVALFQLPLDIAIATLHGYMLRARETVDAWRTSETTFNTLTTVVDIDRVETKVVRIKKEGRTPYGAQERTLRKIKRLAEIRIDSIDKHGAPPTWTKACKEAKISVDTARERAPNLHENWDDPTYRPTEIT